MITAEGVGVRIGSKQIIEDITLHVQEGEFVGIIGPNGSGKSTLLKSIYRVIKQSEGTISLHSRNIETMPLKESALIVAVVSQHNYYNFDFKIEEVVSMGRTPHKKFMEFDNEEDAKIVNDALEKVSMADFKGRQFYTLSGGEQQRIILARALAQQTPCMVLDEPTNHLDIKYQLQLMDLVKELKCTTLCALHDLNIAAAYCDRLYLMKEGRVYAQGKPEAVLTKEIIKDVYEVDVRVNMIPETGLLNIVYTPGYIGGKCAK